MQGNEERAGGGEDFVPLPAELWEAIAQTGLSLEDVQRLAATNPSFAWLAPRINELRQRRALAATAGACQDYLGCALAFLQALGDDDADTAMALVRSGRIPLDEPMDVLTLAGAQEMDHSLVGIASTKDQPPLESNDYMVARLPYDTSPSLYPAGYPYATPLSLAAAAGAERTLARMIRDGAAPWPTPEALLAYALRLPLAIFVRSETQPAYGAVVVDGEEPGVVGPWRHLDTARMVRRIATAYPRSPRIGPWDRNPLQVLASSAIGSVPWQYQGDIGEWPHHVLDIASALVDAGYSPDEPALGKGLVNPRRSIDRLTVRERTRNDLAEAQWVDPLGPTAVILQALDAFYSAI
nr:hypothetical protein [Pandoravirus massiliensis]